MALAPASSEHPARRRGSERPHATTPRASDAARQHAAGYRPVPVRVPVPVPLVLRLLFAVETAPRCCPRRRAAAHCPHDAGRLSAAAELAVPTPMRLPLPPEAAAVAERSPTRLS
jgi:hypothetical protein